MQYSHENKEDYHQLKKVIDCYTNSSCQHLSECMENSTENIFTNVKVLMVNIVMIYSHVVTPVRAKVN